VANGEPVIEITRDLTAEQESLDAIVSVLDDHSWDTPTPAVGWDVRDQIGHLTFFDERATKAITDRLGFTTELARAAGDIEEYMAAHLATTRESPPDIVLSRWRAARAALRTALAPLDPAQRVPWYGPDMSARSFATARLMETWAHGQDIVDALGVRREPTDRLRHIALLGVKTIGWSFSVNGLAAPEHLVRVDLAGPSGDRWVWDAATHDDIVRGDAEHFCLVVTQRRHVSDTGLEITGPVARHWMEIAQAFAGPPGPGRAPGAFS